jgi:hypothetical protein
MLTFAGGGVKATQLTRRVELGYQFQKDCRAEPGESGCPSFYLGDGYPTVQSLMSNVAFY